MLYIWWGGGFGVIWSLKCQVKVFGLQLHISVELSVFWTRFVNHKEGMQLEAP
jgi:hypothetical protein